MKKAKNFIYWLLKYIRAKFFGKVGLPSGSRWDWMTWKEYKRMTSNLKNKP